MAHVIPRERDKGLYDVQDERSPLGSVSHAVNTNFKVKVNY